MPEYLTDARLAEIKADLWPPSADIAALVEEVQTTRALLQKQPHGTMRNRRMYLIGQDRVINLDQIIYACRYQDRLVIWLAGIAEKFTFYDQQLDLDALWEAVKCGQEL